MGIFDGLDEADAIAWLRGEMAPWEREAWRWADQTKAAAERFLLMGTFAASSPSTAALQKAEQQVAMLNRRLVEFQSAVAPYRAGRKPGAVSKFTRALRALIEQAGSREFEAVMPLIEKACYEEPIEGIQFQDCNDHKVWYRDVVTGLEDHITIANPHGLTAGRVRIVLDGKPIEGDCLPAPTELGESVVEVMVEKE